MSTLVEKIEEKFGNLGSNPEANKLILGEVMQLLEDAYKPVKPPKDESPRPSNIEYFEPKSEPEIQEIIRDAFNSKEKTVVRVIGAKHSWSRAISDADKIPKTTRVKLISLTKFRGVEIDAEAKTVTALAGTNFGRDPENEDSTLENSLVYQLDKLGYALPDTGGIIHQTIGGFLSTGSAGGSLFHSLDDAIIGIRIIDGTGEIHDLEDGSDEFLATGVSMGLLGIITKVTFKMCDRFYVTGTQTITGIEPLSQNIFLGCPIDLFGDGDQDQGIPSVSDFFSKGHNHDAEFSRLLWWPQPRVKRLSIWKARSIKGDNLPEFHFNQYADMEEFLGGVVLTFLYATERLDECREVAACLVNFFNTVGINYFQDPWWKGLPMDNDIDFKALPVSFAELWIPFKETKAVMNSMQNLFIEKPESIDNFCNFFTEIYTAKKSKFWLSPGYHEDGGDAVRVNVTYFLEEGLGSPEEYFQYYWDDLKKFNYRCHWGKFTPEGYGKRVKTLYSKYDSWMKIRERMDPKQIFITPYWRSLLDIP